MAQQLEEYLASLNEELAKYAVHSFMYRRLLQEITLVEEELASMMELA